MAAAVYKKDMASEEAMPRLTPTDGRVIGMDARNTMIEPMPKGKLRKNPWMTGTS